MIFFLFFGRFGGGGGRRNPVHLNMNVCTISTEFCKHTLFSSCNSSFYSHCGPQQSPITLTVILITHTLTNYPDTQQLPWQSLIIHTLTLSTHQLPWYSPIILTVRVPWVSPITMAINDYIQSLITLIVTDHTDYPDSNWLRWLPWQSLIMWLPPESPITLTVTDYPGSHWSP